MIYDFCGSAANVIHPSNPLHLITSYISLLERFTAWQKEAEKYRNGEISKEEYDRWRYTYPEVEVQRTRESLDQLRAERKSATE